MSIHIHSIHLTNFRSFKQADIVFQDPKVVIVGANKSGKTNLIQAIDIVLNDRKHRQRIFRLSLNDFWTGIVSKKGLNGEPVIISVDLQGFSDDDPTLRSALLKDGQTRRITYRFEVDPSAYDGSREAYSLLEYRAIWYLEEDSTEDVRIDELGKLRLTILDALRDTENSLAAWSRSPLSPLLKDLGLEGDILPDIASDITKIAEKLRLNDRIDNLRERLQQRSKEMVGEFFEINPFFDVFSADEDTLLQSIRLLIDGENRRTLDRASLGSLNVLYFAMLLEDIKRRTKDSEVIVVLEEPEAHIHPHTQRSIFRHFLTELPSIIVTTHSPHIASVADILSIVLLRY